MDQLLLLHREIKHILDLINLFSPKDKRELLAVIDNLNYDELVKLLKILYKVEREYIEFINDDTIKLEKMIKSLQESK